MISQPHTHAKWQSTKPASLMTFGKAKSYSCDAVMIADYAYEAVIARHTRTLSLMAIPFRKSRTQPKNRISRKKQNKAPGKAGWLRPFSRYTYTGRELNATSGSMYYRYRTYFAGVGRFSSRDPIGYAGGIGLYGYIRNLPIMFNDPAGLYLWIYTPTKEENVTLDIERLYHGLKIVLNFDCKCCPYPHWVLRNGTANHLIIGREKGTVSGYSYDKNYWQRMDPPLTDDEITGFLSMAIPKPKVKVVTKLGKMTEKALDVYDKASTVADAYSKIKESMTTPMEKYPPKWGMKWEDPKWSGKINWAKGISQGDLNKWQGDTNLTCAYPSCGSKATIYKFLFAGTTVNQVGIYFPQPGEDKLSGFDTTPYRRFLLNYQNQ